MDDAENYRQLFESFQKAGQAFHRLQCVDAEIADQELARNPDYLKLHRAGVQIAIIGGRAAINGAIESICKDRTERPEIARQSLERMWFGMGQWGA